MHRTSDAKLITLTGVDSSPAYSTNPATHGDVILVHGDVQSGTPSWTVQGRVSPNAGWVDLLDADETSSKVVAVAACREIRFKQTGTGSTDFYMQ